MVYQLAQRATLQHFRHVVLLASPEDSYAPYHSARIEHHAAAATVASSGDGDDNVWGAVFSEMVASLLSPLDNVHMARIDVSFATANAQKIDAFIGRAAHICFIQHEQYIWRFVALYRRFFD